MMKIASCSSTIKEPFTMILKFATACLDSSLSGHSQETGSHIAWSLSRCLAYAELHPVTLPILHETVTFKRYEIKIFSRRPLSLSSVCRQKKNTNFVSLPLRWLPHFLVSAVLYLSPLSLVSHAHSFLLLLFGQRLPDCCHVKMMWYGFDGFSVLHLGQHFSLSVYLKSHLVWEDWQSQTSILSGPLWKI